MEIDQIVSGRGSSPGRRGVSWLASAVMETVVCQLCNATIRAGSLHKLQLHMETSHDVTENTDLVIALSFLDSQEREVIIDQVIPRMKNILDNDNRSFSC